MSLKMFEKRTQWAKLVKKDISILSAAFNEDLQESNNYFVLLVLLFLLQNKSAQCFYNDLFQLDGYNW